ncbi:MAG: hypothetical protein IT438_00645 [Phycisphaerales bacterium]|nr:hypothetical protein [Phycisphaerales bacterium]
MNRCTCVLVVMVMALAVSAARVAGADVTPPPTGTFSGEGLTLVLAREGANYTGKARLRDGEFPLSGTFDPAKGLNGTFMAGGSSFDWSARVEGKVLKFNTGGTEYNLPIPEASQAPPAAAENPLAKKPAAAPAPAPATAAASTRAGAMKFNRLSVQDPQMNNIEALGLLIPDGWKTEGGVVWLHEYSILANLRMTVTEPTTGAQIQTLPVQNFTWVDNPVMPMQPWTNYMGNIVLRPIRDVATFIKSVYAMPDGRGGLAHLGGARQVGAENLPKVVEQVTAGYGGMSQVAAEKVRFEYERGGKEWVEDVYVALVFTSQQGMTIWTVNTAYAFRAPKADFDRLAPSMTACVNSSRLSLDWFAGYLYVQQLFQNRQNQGIRDAAAISQTISRNSEEIRKMYSDSYRRQCESQDRISRGFSESIRGVETFRNPYEDRSIQLPAGYNDAWVNAQGQYILSSQAGFDPNVGSTVEWRRMEQAK